MVVEKSKDILKDRFYTHPGLEDAVLQCTFRFEEIVKVTYWNVSGGKRKFPMAEEYLDILSFDDNWKDVTQEMCSLPTGITK